MSLFQFDTQYYDSGEKQSIKRDVETSHFDMGERNESTSLYTPMHAHTNAFISAKARRTRNAWKERKRMENEEKKKENWVNQSSFKNKNKHLGGSKIDTTPFNSKPRPAHRLHHHTCDLSSPMRHLLPPRPSAWQSARSTNSCRKTSLLHISFNPIYLGLKENLWV